ncbi:hypothetical protein WJX77_012370 [Trebouxia sp. C0004]
MCGLYQKRREHAAANGVQRLKVLLVTLGATGVSGTQPEKSISSDTTGSSSTVQAEDLVQGLYTCADKQLQGHSSCRGFRLSALVPMLLCVNPSVCN